MVAHTGDITHGCWQRMSETYQPLSREDDEGQIDVEGAIAEVVKLLPEEGGAPDGPPSPRYPRQASDARGVGDGAESSSGEGGGSDPQNVPETKRAVEEAKPSPLGAAVREFLDEDDSRAFLAFALSLQAVCAAVIVSVDSWIALAVGGGIAGCAFCGFVGLGVKVRIDRGEWDTGFFVFWFAWLWQSLLTVVPAALFATADEGAPDAGASHGAAGVMCFVLALWSLGWGFLWWRSPDIHEISPEQRLLEMPPEWLLRLKLVTVVGECYNYCGFSFFPALPWKAMEVPPSVPHPQAVMLAGFLDFGDFNTRLWTFVGASATVLLGFVLFAWKRNVAGTKFLIVQVFFEMLSFPLIKTLTGVFSCTSAEIWTEREDGHGATSLFCNEAVPDGAQCMDTAPAVVCWTSGEHHGYLATTIVLLVPYYLACLWMQLESNKTQSVVVINGSWSIVVTQCKFVLGIIASSFGGCYPIVMAVTVQLVVVGQLALLWSGKTYSSVHSLNAVRVAGLLCGCVNGLFAVYVLWRYQDDPAGAPPCSTIGGSSSGPTVRLVSDYSSFYFLVAVNALALAVGVAWYRRFRDRWATADDGESKYKDLASINSGEGARQVDYPIVRARLRAAEVHLQNATEPFVFDLYTFEDASGQNLERATFDLVLQQEFLAAPNGVRLLNINPDEKSGLMVMAFFETTMPGGVRSWKTCRLARCARIHGVERGWKTCWRGRRVAVSQVEIETSSLSAKASLDGVRVAQDGASAALTEHEGFVKFAKKFVLAAVAQYGPALEHASATLQEDKEVVLAAVAQNGRALEFASAALQEDKEVVLAAVAEDGRALEYASAALREDKEVVLAAVAQSGWALGYASATLREDKEVVLAAVAEDGRALEFASAALREDKEVVLAAVAQSGRALEYASAALREDKEVVLAAKTWLLE